MLSFKSEIRKITNKDPYNLVLSSILLSHVVPFGTELLLEDWIHN
jgi:hypothetical protein